MEKNNVERIKRAVEILSDKIDKHNTEYEVFKKEFWTHEVMKMVTTIVDSKGIKYYDYMVELPNGFYFYVDTFRFNNNCETYYVYAPSKPVCGNYDQHELDSLKYCAERFNRSQKAFQMLQDNADYIINKITEEYKEITEKQSDILDEVFDLIGVDEPKTKHIKVTVEWV